MKFYESLALAISTFVVSGIIVGIVAGSGLARHLPASYGLVTWVLVQTAVTAVLLTLLPRSPITYKAGAEKTA